eukprot:scaffold630_cov174-Amphora_coffeaeformis.AAC.27
MSTLPLQNILGFSEAQRISLAVTKTTMGTVSLLGSSMLIWHASYRLFLHKRKQSSLANNNSQHNNHHHRQHGVSPTFQRLILGMSIVDAISSLVSGSLNTVLTRSDSGGWGAMGNQLTCSFSGFFNQLQLAVPLYNAGLSVYFLVTISYPFRVFRQNGKMMMMMDGLMRKSYPKLDAGLNLILSGSSFYRDDWDCTRGPKDESMQLTLVRWMSFYPMIAACLVLLVVNLLIFCVVVRRECKSRQHTFAASDNHRSNKQIRTVAFQNLLYVGAMVNTVVWLLLANVATFFGGVPERFFFPLYFLYCISFPAQGFWIFLVYIRPQYLFIRRQRKLGRVRAFLEAAMHFSDHSDAFTRTLTRSNESVHESQRSTGKSGLWFTIVRLGRVSSIDCTTEVVHGDQNLDPTDHTGSVACEDGREITAEQTRPNERDTVVRFDDDDQRNLSSLEGE